MESKVSKRTLSELDEEEAKTEQERLAALAKLDDQKRGWRYQERDVLRICHQVASRQIPMDYEWFKFQARQWGIGHQRIRQMWYHWMKEARLRFGYRQCPRRGQEYLVFVWEVA